MPNTEGKRLNAQRCSGTRTIQFVYYTSEGIREEESRNIAKQSVSHVKMLTERPALLLSDNHSTSMSITVRGYC
jgi:hypothetical protein